MIRVDVYLVACGHSRSREAAKKSIEAGLVSIDGKPIKKPGEKIDDSVEHKVVCESSVPYVGRGGLKLEAALDAFRIDPSGSVCIDVGASTGGFTDCLLKRDASKVYAIDSGHGQLAPELASDSRVISLEGLNARYLEPDMIGEPAELIVMDVSFISQTLILPCFKALLNTGGIVVTLIKPQFECGREAVGKGGIVKSPTHRMAAVRRVAAEAEACGLYLSALIRSPIEGGDGNIEFLALFEQTQKLHAETLFGSVCYDI